MLNVKSHKTQQEQQISEKDLKIIDPNGTKFAILSKDTTPPEAKAAKPKASNSASEDRV